MSLTSILTSGLTGSSDPVVGLGLALSNAFYVRPVATGLKNGTSWENAISLTLLPEALLQLASGGTIYLAAWDGNFVIDGSHNRFLLARPASLGPATIRGAAFDLSPAKAPFNGTRHIYNGVNYSRSSDPQNDGHDAFQIDDGATNLTLSHFTFNNIGWGINAIGSATNLHVTDVDGLNMNLLFTNTLTISGGSSRANTLQFQGLVLQRLTCQGYEIAMLKIGQIIDNLLVEDCIGNALYYVGNNNSFQEGIHVRTRGAAIVRRCKCVNSIWTGPSGSYWNGDGFATEAEVTSILYEDCEGEGSSDSAFDNKADATTYVRCIGRNNKISFRNWGRTTVMTDCESHLPHKLGGPNEPEHIQFNKTGGAPGDIHTAVITRMIITGDATHEAEIIHVTAGFNSTDQMIIDWIDYDINVDANTPLLALSSGLLITPTVNWTSAKANCPTANTGTNRMNADGNSYSAEALAVYAAAPADISITAKLRIETDIAAMKAAGIWTKTAALWVTASYSRAGALVNWKAPGTNDLTEVGELDWVRKQGFFSLNQAGELESGLALNAATPYVQNSCHVFAVETLASDLTKSLVLVGDDGDNVRTASISPMTAVGGQIQYRVNAVSSGSSGSGINTSQGILVANRTSSGGAGATSISKNGVKGATGSVSAQAIASTTFKLLPQGLTGTGNENEPSGWIGAAGLGSGLTDQNIIDHGALWKAHFNEIIPGLIP